MLTVATCAADSPSLFTLNSLSASATACVRHVPNCVDAGMTQSPFSKLEDPGLTTSKTPSLPGRAEGSGVPIRELNSGLTP